MIRLRLQHTQQLQPPVSQAQGMQSERVSREIPQDQDYSLGSQDCVIRWQDNANAIDRFLIILQSNYKT